MSYFNFNVSPSSEKGKGQKPQGGTDSGFSFFGTDSSENQDRSLNSFFGTQDQSTQNLFTFSENATLKNDASTTPLKSGENLKQDSSSIPNKRMKADHPSPAPRILNDDGVRGSDCHRFNIPEDIVTSSSVKNDGYHGGKSKTVTSPIKKTLDSNTEGQNANCDFGLKVANGRTMSDKDITGDPINCAAEGELNFPNKNSSPFSSDVFFKDLIDVHKQELAGLIPNLKKMDDNAEHSIERTMLVSSEIMGYMEKLGATKQAYCSRLSQLSGFLRTIAKNDK